MKSVCKHCASELANPSEIKSGFCCDGCAGAYEWIHRVGLEHYYQWRTGSRDQEASKLMSEQELEANYLRFDQPELLASIARKMDVQASASLESWALTLSVSGMHCAACAWLIEQSLARLEGVGAVRANALTGYLYLEFTPTKIALSQVLITIARLGYRVFLAQSQAQVHAENSERKRWQLRLGVALIAAFQAMMFAEALYLDTNNSMASATRDAFRWIAFLLTTPVVFFSGWPFLRGAYFELKAKALGMDCLVALSTLLAYFGSIVETLRGGPHVYFDAAVMFVLLLLIPRGLDVRARTQARAILHRLSRVIPDVAERVQCDRSDMIAVEKIRVGDLLRVRSGEPIPVDGILLSEACAASAAASGADTVWASSSETRLSIDESVLTGESEPVLHALGDTVLAGCVALETLYIRCARESSMGFIAKLSALAEQQQALRTPMEVRFLSLSQGFSIAMLAITLISFLTWLYFEPARAFEIALCTLAVSCPCALALAAPATLNAARVALWRAGVLVLRPFDLRALSKLRWAIFDKTGTLTDARIDVFEYGFYADFDQDQALRIAAAIGVKSSHPVSRAIHQFAQARLAAAHREPQEGELRDVAEHAGQGIHAYWNGRSLRLGQARFALARSVDDDRIWLSLDGQPLAWWRWREALRSDSLSALQDLSARGVNCAVLSGDCDSRVSVLSERLPLAKVEARASPQRKLEALRELKRDGLCLMVGDGMNDAPVLAAADFSVSMASAAALSLRQADMVLTHNRLGAIPEALAIAAQCSVILRQNLSWAIAYNALMIPAAVSGQIVPWQAALGMAASSLFVTLNASRLLWSSRRNPPSQIATGAKPAEIKWPEPAQDSTL